MLRATVKSLLARRSRLVLSLIAIVLGVAFLSAVLTFNKMINSTFQGLLSGSIPDVNVNVAGLYSQSGAVQRPTRQIDDKDIAKIKEVPGVADAVGTITVQNVYLLDSHNKMIGNGVAPAFAMNYISQPSRGGQPGIVIKSGRAPQREGEVVIDPAALDKSGFQIGDPIEIASGRTGSFAATIVGTGGWGSGAAAAGTYAFFDTATMQKLFLDSQKSYAGAWVVRDRSVTDAELAARVNKVLPTGYEAVDAKTASDYLNATTRNAMSYLTGFLLVFAGFGLLVSVFLIVNTFSIVVAQRIKELALFRALGAKKRQVVSSVLLEALIIGFVGSLLGLFLGLGLAVGLAHVLRTVGLDLGQQAPRLAPSTVLACFAVGVPATVLASLVPAFRAGGTAPVVAMTGRSDDQRDTGQDLAATVGVWVSVLGMLVFLAGLVLRLPVPRGAPIGLGAALTLIGVAMASPLLGWPVIAGIGRLFQAMFGEVGRLAALNSRRNPRRTAATASALMVGLALVTTFAIMGASARGTISDAVDKHLHGDLFIVGAQAVTFQSTVGDAVATIPGVKEVRRQTVGTFTRDNGDGASIGTADAAGFGAFWDRTLVQGKTPSQPGEAMANANYAKNHGLAIGQKLKGVLGNKAVDLVLVGTYTDPQGFPATDLLTPRGTWQKAETSLEDSRLAVLLAPGADRVDIHKQIREILTKLPMVKVVDREGYAKELFASSELIFNMLYMLLAVAVLIAVLGIVNTMVLSVMERRRETGLLRAVGLLRRQLRSMIALESIIIAVLGAVLGMALGVLFGWGLVSSMSGQVATRVVIPWLQLMAFLGASVVAGVLAAIIPAIWATRVNVLDAIATE